jgi:hypothetical protein
MNRECKNKQGIDDDNAPRESERERERERGKGCLTSRKKMRSERLINNKFREGHNLMMMVEGRGRGRERRS